MRIFLECTATYLFDGNTGIQRVVRNIVNRSTDVGREQDIDCQPMIYVKDVGFCPIDGLAPPDPTKKETFGQFIRRVLSPTLKRMRILGAVQWVLKVSRAIGRGFRRLTPLEEIYTPVSFEAGDVILLMDSSWTTPYWKDLKIAQDQGVRVGFLIYDLIPMLRPEVTNCLILAAYPKWWHQVCKAADFIECISRTVCQDVETWFEDHDIPERSEPVECGWFHLGHDLDGCSVREEIRPEFHQLLAEEFALTYLMVGSINPRKNHLLVLDAFDRLWAEGSDARLVIIGNIGWTTEAFERRVKKHRQRNRRLFWYCKVSDAELDFAYKNARALITASNAEGFNLPIVEALERGCPVYASDFPVHREVGGEHAAYFSVDSASNLYQLLDRDSSMSAEELRSRTQSFTWPDWPESCRQLLTNLSRQGDRKTRSAKPKAA